MKKISLIGVNKNVFNNTKSTLLSPLILLIGFTLLAFSCTKEAPLSNDFSIKAISINGGDTVNYNGGDISISAGDKICFELNFSADFCVFYAGTKGADFNPGDTAISNHPSEQASYVINGNFFTTPRYYEKGNYTAKFVLNSYGNWAEKHTSKVATVNIKVIDDKIGIKSLVVLNGHTMTAAVLTGNSYVAHPKSGSILTTSVLLFDLESSFAKVFIDKNNDGTIDFSSEEYNLTSKEKIDMSVIRKFVIVSANGNKSQEYTLEVIPDAK